MGKFQNFDKNAEERRVMQLQHERRMALRAQFWKNMTDPNRHGTGEGGFLVCTFIQAHITYGVLFVYPNCYVINLIVYCVELFLCSFFGN